MDWRGSTEAKSTRVSAEQSSGEGYFSFFFLSAPHLHPRPHPRPHPRRGGVGLATPEGWDWLRCPHPRRGGVEWDWLRQRSRVQ
jgi:hypothetical protein